MSDHVKGMKDQLLKILQNDWQNHLQGPNSQKNGSSQRAFDSKIEKGETVNPSAYILAILENMNKMYKALSVTLEQSHFEQLFKEAFRQLANEIDSFFQQISTESKYAKMRARIDLTHVQKVISGFKFSAENQDEITDMALQKIKAIINTKCGLSVEKQETGRVEVKKNQEVIISIQEEEEVKNESDQNVT